MVAPYPSIAITIILLHNFITRLLPQFLNEERVGLSDCPLEKPGDTAKSQTTCLYTALKQLDNYKFIKLMIKESVPKPSSCKHCKYYNYEGRRGGQCRLLNVPVRANWCACPLGVPITDILTTHSSSTPSTTRCGLLEDALPVKSSLLPAKILCCYTNDTDQHQIIRISNIPCWFLERAVFPGQSITFRAFSDGLLEIHTGVFSGSILSDLIPCDQLLLSDYLCI